MTTLHLLPFLACAAAAAADPWGEATATLPQGGLVAIIGQPPAAALDLGRPLQVRILVRDSGQVAAVQREIQARQASGRCTVSVWDGERLPFVERGLDAVLVCAGTVPAAEINRTVAPGGWVVEPGAARRQPWPDTIDGWTHHLYDASGNAVSRDREVASPRSLRWWAPPISLRSHNYSSSFTGLVGDRGRMFHFADVGTPLFDRGGTTERWELVARNAWNGALLWRQPLHGYGAPGLEDVSGQAVADLIWRSPLSLNRRMVAIGDRLVVARHYRQGPLAILDAATGAVLHEVDLGGIVDELVVADGLVVCRVRSRISEPDPGLTRDQRWATEQRLINNEGVAKNQVRAELDARQLDRLMREPPERVVALDLATGAVRWQREAPQVAVQSLALAPAQGRVVFHNYRSLVCLDAAAGTVVWEVANPIVQRQSFGTRNLLGNLLIAEGTVLWTSNATGGGLALDLATGAVRWRHPNRGVTGGFAMPTALRAIRGTVWYDNNRGFSLADGKDAPSRDLGGMMQRGHHVRCLPGKATERFLILPERGAEFVDLDGDQHMINDWFRPACGMGLVPAFGMVINTPDPCSCYAGARIGGFFAMAANLPAGLDQAPAATDTVRLTRGPAFGTAPGAIQTGDWPQFRADAGRSARSGLPIALPLQPQWTTRVGAQSLPVTAAAGRVYAVRREGYELHCLTLRDGAAAWTYAFPGALDGPPSITGDLVLAGCRDGHVYALRASDGALAWRFRAAPLDRLTLSDDRLENVWPVSTSVLVQGGLAYVAAGRNSYLDGGIHVYALDPATGAVRHHQQLDGPWPTREQLRTPVVTENALKQAKGPEDRQRVLDRIRTQPTTGYDMQGGQADLLVGDGTNVFMMRNQFAADLGPIAVQRAWHTGHTPMAGQHLMANYGFLNDTMNHRTYRLYDSAWPGYSGGSGWAARAGTQIALGATRAYAAKHFEGGWYPTHKPGDGNRLTADTYDHANTSGDQADEQVLRELKQYSNPGELVRTKAAQWDRRIPLIVRALLCAPDGQGGEHLFVAGIVEGTDQAAWDRSTRFDGPGKLLVVNGADGATLAEYDLPACPVYDGLSAAAGRLLVSLVDGQVLCLANP